jgi:hypothetical protein
MSQAFRSFGAAYTRRGTSPIRTYPKSYPSCVTGTCAAPARYPSTSEYWHAAGDSTGTRYVSNVTASPSLRVGGVKLWSEESVARRSVSGEKQLL